MASLEFNPTPAAKPEAPDLSHVIHAAYTPPTEGGGGNPSPPGGTEGGGGKGKGGSVTDTNNNTNNNNNLNRNLNVNHNNAEATSSSTGAPINIKTMVAPDVGVASYALPNCGVADGIGISTLFGGGSLSHTRISDKCLASNEWLEALDMANRGITGDANVGLSALSLLDTEQKQHILPNDAYGQARAKIEGAFAVQSLSNSLGSQELALATEAQKLGMQVPLNQLGSLPDATIGTGPQDVQTPTSQAITVIAAAYASSGERGVAHVGHHTITKKQAENHGCVVTPDGQITLKGETLHVDKNDNLVTPAGKVVYHLDKTNSQ